MDWNSSQILSPVKNAFSFTRKETAKQTNEQTSTTGFVLTFRFHQLTPIVCDQSLCHDQLENKLLTVSLLSSFNDMRGENMTDKKTIEKPRET